MIKAFLIPCCLLALFAPFAGAADSGSALKPEQAEVVQVVEAALEAAQADNAQAFESHLAPGFYMFDGGKRFDAPGIMAEMRQAAAAGTHMQWLVTQPDVHIDGRTAWIAYVNDGSMTTASETRKRQWLESAYLVRISDTWKIDFWHSTPVRQ